MVKADRCWTVNERLNRPRGRPSKRKASELQPGLKEIEQEEAARNTQELLDVFAAGELVEARGLAGCHL